MQFRSENQAIYRALEQVICARFPDVQIRETKTQVGFFLGCGFAWASERGPRFILSLGLRCRLDSPRLFHATESYPGRWTNHIVLASPDEIDAAVLVWLDDARAFALERALKGGRLK